MSVIISTIHTGYTRYQTRVLFVMYDPTRRGIGTCLIPVRFLHLSIIQSSIQPIGLETEDWEGKYFFWLLAGK